jgi:hypothetical protein
MLLQAYLQTLLFRLQKGTEELLLEAMGCLACFSCSTEHSAMSGWHNPVCHLLSRAHLPITPGLMFGPGVDDILEQTDKVRRDRETLRRCMPPPQAPGPRRTVTTQLHPSNGEVPLLLPHLVLNDDSKDGHSVQWSNNLSTVTTIGMCLGDPGDQGARG